MKELVLNGQPVGKLVYNADNFRRLQDAYAEAMDLIVKLNARLATAEVKETKRAPRTKKEAK